MSAEKNPKRPEARKSVKIAVAEWKAVKIAAAEHGTTIQQIVVEAIEKYLSARGAK